MSLNISTQTILQNEFYGSGISQYILKLAEKNAKEANLPACKLVVN
jgi:hypothetical protein